MIVINFVIVLASFYKYMKYFKLLPGSIFSFVFPKTNYCSKDLKKSEDQDISKPINPTHSFMQMLILIFLGISAFCSEENTSVL